MDSSLSTILFSGQLYPALDSLQSTKFLAVACFALLVYDYFLTLEQEVRELAVYIGTVLSFWRREWVKDQAILET